MSEFTTPSEPVEGSLGAGSTSMTETDKSTREVAGDQARSVAGDAQQAGAHVAGTAKDQAAEVAGEAKNQARRLVDEARSELNSQAASQGQRAASSLHSLADELDQMKAAAPSDGYTAQLVSPAAERTRDLARWLENRQPGDMVQELTSYARRRPGMFLLAAAAAGVVAGRLTRGMVDDHRDSANSPSTGNGTTGFTPAQTTGYADPGTAYAPPAGSAYTGGGNPPPETSGPGSLWSDEGTRVGSEGLGGLGTPEPASYDQPVHGDPLTAQDPHAGQPEEGLR